MSLKSAVTRVLVAIALAAASGTVALVGQRVPYVPRAPAGL